MKERRLSVMRWVWVLGMLGLGCAVVKERGTLGQTSASDNSSARPLASAANPPKHEPKQPAATPPAPGAEAEVPGKPRPCEARDSLWSGSVGERRIVMEIRACGGHVGARYFTDADLHSRLLYAPNGEVSELRGLGSGEQAFEPSDIVAKSEGFRFGGYVGGTWKEGGRTLAWEMYPVGGVASYDSLRERRGAIAQSVDKSFRYQRLSSFQESVFCIAKPGRKPPIPVEAFPQGFVEGRDGECESGEIREVAYDWVEILEARAPLLVQRSNLALKRKLTASLPSPDSTWGGEVKLIPIYARGRVFSLMSHTDGPGLGAYPAHDEYGLVLDLRSGDLVKLEDQLKIFSKRSHTYADREPEEHAFIEMLNERLPLKRLGPGPEDGCDWGDSLPSPHFTKRGLHLTPSLPHVIKVCQYENLSVPVPREIARRYAKPGSLLEQILAGHWGP